MKNAVDILDFDEGYKLQSYYRNLNYSWIDFLDMKNVNRYCEEKSLISIYKRLIRKKKSKITFIGNGNYHYVTYLLLKEVKIPFTLVLFDHHTDMMEVPSESLVSCGSWVLRALKKLPYLKKVIIIGANDELISPIMRSDNSRVFVLSEEEIKQGIDVEKHLISQLVTDNVYISVDKDVLAWSEVNTNWDQGNMKLHQLTNVIHYLCENKKVCGVDVCGEYYVKPYDYFNPQVITAINKNNKANLALLKEAKKII